MSDTPETIMHEGKLYVRHDLAGAQVHQLRAEIAELKQKLNVYRQVVFEAKERLGKLDGDQADWLNQEQGT